jgi:uncharacterized membrane protein
MILVELSGSIGEFYFLLPFIVYLIEKESKKGGINFYIYINNRELLNILRNDALFSAIRNKLRLLYIAKTKSRFLRFLVIPLKMYLYILIKVATLIFVPITRLSLPNKRSFPLKKAIMYPHTSGPMFFSIDTNHNYWKQSRSPEKNHNITSIANYASYENLYYQTKFGMKKFLNLGFHVYTADWKHFIASITSIDFPYIVILSYQIREENMPREDWLYLHLTTYYSIRRIFGDIQVLIKPHPRQNVEELNRLIESRELKNVSITNTNSYILGYHCVCAVGFLTSGVFNALYGGKPGANFYVSREHYEREMDLFKHEYSLVGIPDLRTEEELNTFLIEVRDGEAKSTFVSNAKKEQLVTRIDELLINSD